MQIQQPGHFTPDRIKKLKTQILTTKGMSSAVFNPDTKDNTKFQFIGHVFSGDYDGEDFHFVLDEAMKNMYVNNEFVTMLPKVYPKTGWYQMFPGISAIFKSSDTGYHLWNLTIRSRIENSLIGMQTHIDQVHNAISFRRHCWILRITPKMVGSDEDKIYKPAPELVRVVYAPTDRPQSLPHYRLVQALSKEVKVPIKFPSTKNINFDGIALDIEAYITITDKMKENWKRLKGDDE